MLSSPRRPVRTMRIFSSAENWRRVTRRSEEHTSELQSQSNLVCRLLLEKKKQPSQLPISPQICPSAPILPHALEPVLFHSDTTSHYTSYIATSPTTHSPPYFHSTQLPSI